jgi:hypothetical protein
MEQTPRPFLRIVDPRGKDPADWCTGPTATGDCPRVEAGQLVPCAGKLLFPFGGHLKPSHGRWVSARENECPLPILFGGGG